MTYIVYIVCLTLPNILLSFSISAGRGLRPVRPPRRVQVPGIARGDQVLYKQLRFVTLILRDST